MKPITRRSVMAGAAAAVAVVPIPALAVADVGGDAELRRLWAEYIAQLSIYWDARDAYRERRAEFDAEIGSIPGGGSPRPIWNRLWKKRGMEPFSVAWNREGRKLRRVVKKIRMAKAESMFGVGVKLSVFEDEDARDEWFGDAIDDARRSLVELTSVDFIAATGGALDALMNPEART